MRAWIQFGIGAALIGILLRIGIWRSGQQYSESFDAWVTYANLFLVLASVFLTVLITLNREPEIPLLNHWQDAMKAAAVFAILSASYTYIHFRWIDPEFLNSKINTRMEAAEKMDFKQFENNPHQLTREEFIEKEKGIVHFIYNPFNHASFVLFGYLVMGAVYSVILTLGVRKLKKATSGLA